MHYGYWSPWSHAELKWLKWPFEFLHGMNFGVFTAPKAFTVGNLDEVWVGKIVPKPEDCIPFPCNDNVAYI